MLNKNLTLPYQRNIGGAAPFSPLDLGATLKGWFDAADASTFTFSSGNVVSQWNDKSGNNNHLTQPTVGLQPTRSATINGLPAVKFDGVDDTLNNVALGTILNAETPYVVCGVLKVGTIDNGRQWGCNLSATSKGSSWFYVVSTTKMNFRSYNTIDSPGAIPTPLIAVDALMLLTHTWDILGTLGTPRRCNLRYNGALVTAGGAGTAAQVGASGDYCMGSRLPLTAGYSNCTWAEKIILDSAVLVPQLAQIEAYLNAKWAVY